VIHYYRVALAALAVLGGLVLLGRVDLDTGAGHRGLPAVGAVEGFAGDDAVDLSQNVLESQLDVAGIEG
jgi:hypothetical protein